METHHSNSGNSTYMRNNTLLNHSMALFKKSNKFILIYGISSAQKKALTIISDMLFCVYPYDATPKQKKNVRNSNKVKKTCQAHVYWCAASNRQSFILRMQSAQACRCCCVRNTKLRTQLFLTENDRHQYGSVCLCNVYISFGYWKRDAVYLFVVLLIFFFSLAASARINKRRTICIFAGGSTAQQYLMSVNDGAVCTSNGRDIKSLRAVINL